MRQRLPEFEPKYLEELGMISHRQHQHANGPAASQGPDSQNNTSTYLYPPPYSFLGSHSTGAVGEPDLSPFGPMVEALEQE